MKLSIILAAIFVMGFSSVSAATYDYPGVFIENGNLDAVVVVGNLAPASDVIAQNSLVQYLAGYLGKPLPGAAKLSGEITSLNQNMILIGSACNNPITSQALGYPAPCNKGTEPGKPMISLFRNNGYFYLIIAGYTEKETRDAADSLASHDSLELAGDLIFSSQKNAKDTTEPEAEQANLTADIEYERQKQLEELSKKIQESGDIAQDAPSINDSKEEQKANIINTTELPGNDYEEKENIIRRVIYWIKSLFG